ncbi:D-inositol-3-phosphate glycosyltransferase [compost metagenome]
MARGAPVVQPDHGSFPELMAQTGGGVLVPPGNAASLADAMASLLNDPARRDALAHAGRTAVERDFTEEQIATRMVGVYEALL